MEYDLLFVNFWKFIIDDPIFINNLVNTKEIINFINNLIERKILNENSTISIDELKIFNEMLHKFISDNPLIIIPENFKARYIWITHFILYSIELEYKSFYSIEFLKIWIKNQFN